MMRVPVTRSIKIRVSFFSPRAVFGVDMLVTSHFLSVLEFVPTQLSVEVSPGKSPADKLFTAGMLEETRIKMLRSFSWISTSADPLSR